MPGSIRIIDGRVYDALIANNTLNGPFDSAGIGLANQVRPVAQGNVVTGAAGEPGAGFFLTADALGTSCAPPAPGVACSDPATLVGATLTHNVVRGMKFGLQLDSSGASGFAALVSINDFVASTLFGVKLSASYPTTSAFHADLSELGEGNYWGHSCGADGTGGFTSSDSSNVNVAVDSHPFGISTTTSPLPPTCR